MSRLVLFILLLALAACAGPAARPDLPTPTPTRAAFSQAAPGFGYGIQIDWAGSPLGGEGQFAALNEMGFNWAKLQVRWCDLQPQFTPPDWSPLDAVDDLARAHGVRLLITVTCGPAWAGPTTLDGNPGPPDDPKFLASALRELAARYCPSNGGALGAIEVWNETNLSREWGGRPLRGRDYMGYLKPAYVAIKSACPELVVVSGGPTPTGVTNANAVADDLYLQEMYQAGLKEYSDAVGIHPSGYNVPADCDIESAGCAAPPGTTWLAPWTSRHYSFGFLSMMNTYRRIMAANGDEHKPLWATEFGWGVAATPFAGYEYERDNTPEEQAEWLTTAFRQARQWGWVGAMFVWNLDFTTGESAAFSILNRPAQAALAALQK